MPGKPKNYTPEFKEQAVRKVVDSSPPRTIAEVARELNINGPTGSSKPSCGSPEHWPPPGSTSGPTRSPVSITSLGPREDALVQVAGALAAAGV